MKSLLTILLLLLFSLNTAFSQSSGEEEQVINTLQAFERAIVNNNHEAASELLSDRVRILEGGGIETKEEYLSHHFHSDGKFLSAMERKVESRSVFIEGNTAWVTTQSRLQGSYSDRQLDLTSLELAVLKKTDNQWKITALHWSSSARD